MNSPSFKSLHCSDVHSIFYPLVKGILVVFGLSGIVGPQLALAVDFKTYLKGARAEIFRHKEIVRKDPLDAIAYFELGRAYLAVGKHKKEVQSYREAIELNPMFIAAHYNLSMAYDLLKDGPNAIKHMQRSLKLFSEKRNHVQMRNVRRQLKRLYLKYSDKVSSSKSLN
jgi:tetratricopeptide (TPR) repeat protein